jgi:phosphate transport system substrate-binding protein
MYCSHLCSIILAVGLSFLISCGNDTTIAELKRVNPDSMNPTISSTERTDTAKVLIRIKGSQSLLPLIQMKKNKFLEKQTAVDIKIEGTGSNSGVEALLKDSTDIAISSRPLNLNERIELQQKDREIHEKIVCLDAIAVVVHKENPIQKLTLEQIEMIYTGKITNWKQLGGINQTIIVLGRDAASGTRDYFNEKVVNNKKTVNTLRETDSKEMMTAISHQKNAIGYTGVAYLKNSPLKAVQVAKQEDEDYFFPTPENIKNGNYPITRALHFYYFDSAVEKVKPFIDFVLSKEGQDVMLQYGYTPL